MSTQVPTPYFLQRHTGDYCAPTVAIQQGSNFEVLHKKGHPVLQLHSLLSIQVLFGSIHLSLFFFDIIEYFANNNIQKNKRLFTFNV